MVPAWNAANGKPSGPLTSRIRRLLAHLYCLAPLAYQASHRIVLARLCHRVEPDRVLAPASRGRAESVGNEFANRRKAAYQSLMQRAENELIPTRASLIKRLKDWQDQASWQDFFETYWKLIYGVARRAGMTDAEAQDVVQETMASVARHMPAFTYDPAIGSFKTWLLKMTRWRIIDQVRKRGPLAAHRSLPTGADDDTRTEAMEKLIDPASEALDDLWNAEWERNLFDAAVAKVKRHLDPQKYQIFDLYVNKEWPAEKVASRFGVSVDQVYMARHRVTEAIRKEVARLEHQGL